MKTLKRITSSLVAMLACGVCGIVGPGSAMAESPPPSYASPLPTYATAEQTIHGRIASIDGQYSLTVHDDNGYLDTIALHHGTIINPTGLTLAPGMSVTIIGYNGGSAFVANEIDTPYTYAGPFPTTVYYGPGWWYPGFAYGYGPSYGLIVTGGYPVYHPFHPPHPWVGPAPEPRPYVGHPYVGNH
jgi:hypothetical protein